VRLIDLNLLLYAYHAAAKEHKPALSWLTERFAGRESIGLAWVTLLGFLRIATAPKILTLPYDLGQATEIVSDWLMRSNVLIVSPTERHWPILRGFLPKHRVRGSLIVDAHLAALAIEHGATLCTNDRDFLRFPGLKVEFPLQ
jgi:toxin-antitoxin system PIN domain toxin